MTRFGLLGLLLLCACGRQPGQSPQPEASPKAGDARAQRSAATLPDYLPPYPDATPVEIANLGAAGTDSRSGNAVAMETGDAPAEVIAFYRARFAAAGVPVRVDSTTPQGGVMGVGRDGERGAMLTIGRRGDKTRITVISAPGGH